jgi:hypothetical protein
MFYSCTRSCYVTVNMHAWKSHAKAFCLSCYSEKTSRRFLRSMHESQSLQHDLTVNQYMPNREVGIVYSLSAKLPRKWNCGRARRSYVRFELNPLTRRQSCTAAAACNISLTMLCIRYNGKFRHASKSASENLSNLSM